MRYSIAAAAALTMLESMVAAAPSVLRRQSSSPPSLQDLSDAQNKWSSDTSIVSDFLTKAAGLSGQDLIDAATIALNAENDELLHKQVLDNQFTFVANPDPSVQAANNELVDQLHFKQVVDALQNLVSNGANMSPDDVSNAIISINANRCNNVLPAIDTYFKATASLLQNGVILVANRPLQCTSGGSQA